VVFTRIDDEREVKDLCYKDGELNARINQGQLELQTHQPLTSPGHAPARPQAASLEKRAQSPPQPASTIDQGITTFDVKKETEILRGRVEKLLRRLGATQITEFHKSESGTIVQCIDRDGMKTFVKYEVRYYKNPIRRQELEEFTNYVRDKKSSGASGGVYITNGTFEGDVREDNIELIDGKRLDELLRTNTRT
jgi:restriction endonuclease Mrr